MPTLTPTLAPTPTPTESTTPLPTSPPLPSPEVLPLRSEYWRAPEPYGQPVYGGVVGVSHPDFIDTFDAWAFPTDSAFRMRSLTHEQLVRQSPYDDAETVPSLAEGWTIAPDDTAVTFFFEDGISWHDGDPFTCQDALFSVETMWKGIELGRVSLSATADRFFFIDSLECVDAADRSTQALKVDFTEPYPEALQAFAQPGAFIFQERWFQRVGEAGMHRDMSVGTGPWVWDGDPPGSATLTFFKNQGFHYEDVPYLDRLVWQSFTDPFIQQIAMEERQSDWTWVDDPDQYTVYVANDGIITVARGQAAAAFWPDLEGYYHFPIAQGFTAFDHVWLNPAKAGEAGFAGQTTGWPGGN